MSEIDTEVTIELVRVDARMASRDTDYLCTISDQYEVNTFLPLRGGLSIESVKDDENVDGFIPSNMIPFAYDRGGDLYFVNILDQAIYSIRGETIDRHVLIANSFKDFIEILNKSDKR